MLQEGQVQDYGEVSTKLVAPLQQRGAEREGDELAALDRTEGVRGYTCLTFKKC